jgi:hypothetical protein
VYTSQGILTSLTALFSPHSEHMKPEFQNTLRLIHWEIAGVMLKRENKNLMLAAKMLTADEKIQQYYFLKYFTKFGFQQACKMYS